MTRTTHDKVNIYGQNQKVTTAPTGNSRDTDSRALAACARRLDDARKLMESNRKSRENLRIYGEAIRHNQRLWTIFQVALCDPHNPLPQDLKVTLLNLSRYVDKASFRAIGKYMPDLIASLIDINRLIAAGLSKQTENPTFTPPLDASALPPTSLMTSA
jgi:flagellar protein FlaF